MKALLFIFAASGLFAQTVTVTGSANGSSLSVTFKKLQPAPTLKALSCAGSPDSSGAIALAPGASSTCKVTLSRAADAAPAVTTVILASTNTTDFVVPTSVIVQPGTDNSTFTVSATPATQ